MLSKLRILNRIGRKCVSPQIMGAVPQRLYLEKIGLDSTSLAKMHEAGEKAGEVDLWKANVSATENALVLSTADEIDSYVLSITKDYFLSTNTAAITLDCMFSDHGLDSLDVIELVIQMEDELGYVIDGENLDKFKKPKHLVNFIKHMEAYKEEHSKLPHEGTKAEFNRKEIFPGLPF